ncbi:MAG: HlyD family efflux transporter periplasmic adaptor subunit [Planctomycetota bacterium]
MSSESVGNVDEIDEFDNALMRAAVTSVDTTQTIDSLDQIDAMLDSVDDSAIPPMESTLNRVDTSELAPTNESLAAAIELQSELDGADTLDDACHHLSHRLAQILDARRVVLVWRPQPDAPMRVLGDTCNDSVTSQSIETDHLMAAAAAEELVIVGDHFQWLSRSSDSTRGGTQTLRQLARHHADRRLNATLLRDDMDQARGACLIFDAEVNGTDRFCSAVAPLVTSRLAAIERLEPGWLASSWSAFCHAMFGSGPMRPRLSTLALIIVGTLVLLLAPATYTISVPLEMQPVTRRYVTVPFDGPLKSCEVRPGDLVAEGEVLAEIDPREIQYELAGVRSQLEQANQSRKGRIAEQDFAAGRLAELESRRLQLKANLLIDRQANLDIRSPITGMIVSGDWRSREAMPLTRGETLFEVAPLDQMIVELWVHESEISHVRPGMAVRLATNAAPETTLAGVIEHLHPQAHIREHDNVFIAEVVLDNPSRTLRPGMRGHAKIYGDAHPIGWNLFHRPLDAILTWLRW